jgi:hypothetical protein
MKKLLLGILAVNFCLAPAAANAAIVHVVIEDTLVQYGGSGGDPLNLEGATLRTVHTYDDSLTAHTNAGSGTWSSQTYTQAMISTTYVITNRSNGAEDYYRSVSDGSISHLFRDDYGPTALSFNNTTLTIGGVELIIDPRVHYYFGDEPNSLPSVADWTSYIEGSNFASEYGGSPRIGNGGGNVLDPAFISYRGDSASAYGAVYAEGALPPGLVPIPAAVWLFGSSLGLLGWMKSRSIKVAT